MLGQIEDEVLDADMLTVIDQPCPYHECPLTVYRLLTDDRPDTLMLESASIDSKDNLKSILLTHAAMRITCNDSVVSFEALTDNGKRLLPLLAQSFSDKQIASTEVALHIRLTQYHADLDEDARLTVLSPLDGLRVFVKKFSSQASGALPLFLCGVLAYDLVAAYEPLPAVSAGFNTCPDYVFYVAETLLIMDHVARSSTVVSYLFDDHRNASDKLAFQLRNENIVQRCRAARESADVISSKPVAAAVEVDVSDKEYCDVVARMRQHIEAGDIFQGVPSRGFTLPCPNPLGAYQVLKRTNPSPYMFYVRTQDFVLFGASPESALKFTAQSRQVEIYPIAGTRRRGKDRDGNLNHDLDSRIELELRQDQKELAEHMMLVDLARNDIARICEPGSRRVPDLLKVDRYSHVMHLVSRVTGVLRQGLDALHAYQACMNMGTLVGAPKVRAAQLIRDVEGRRRGSYGGAVGYITAEGDMDTSIVIRSAFVRDGVAFIQAGAGVVYDSNPQAEADETRSKAQAVINAIQTGGGA